MRVGVLGAEGFVGGALVRGLASDEIETVSVERMPIPFGPLDVAGTASLSVWVTGVAKKNLDWLINAAGAAVPALTDWERLLNLNVRLPLYLAEALSTGKPRIVHISTAAVCGRGPITNLPATLRACGTPYARSKCLGEYAIMTRALESLIIRVGSVVDGDRHGAVRRALARTPVIILSRRQTSLCYPLVTLSEVVEACRSLLIAPPDDRPIMVCVGAKTGFEWARAINDRAQIVLLPDVITRLLFGLAYAMSSRAVSMRAIVRAAEVFVRGQNVRLL